jgi:hypothetical protein
MSHDLAPSLLRDPFAVPVQRPCETPQHRAGWNRDCDLTVYRR